MRSLSVRKVVERVGLVMVVLAAFVGSSLSSPPQANAHPQSQASIAGCTTVNNVAVNQVQWSGIFQDYWYSSQLTTTGCGSTSNIRAATNTMHGPTCASLRVRLFPSSGGSIVPRGWQYVCPSFGYVELANYILTGTTYRVESDLGAATVSVIH